MILYFADRGLNILGLAGDKIKRGYNIENDEKEISIGTGVATFSFDISYNDENRAEVEKLTYAGNYILTYSENEKTYECYTIIDTKQSTETKSINVYSEDIGLDLINDVCLPFNYETASHENNTDHAEEGNAANKGYINESGAFVSDNNYRATNHMGLPSTLPEAYLFEVSKSESGTKRYSVAFYTSNKTFIANSGKYYYISESDQVTRVDVPSNARYVRISFHKDCTSVYFMASSVKSYSISEYISRCISNSGFEIGLDEFGNIKFPIEFDETQTASERILDIADNFGAEISFSYNFNGLRITQKLLNIHKHRGGDNRVELRLGKDVRNIQINRSVAELATAILAVGNTFDADGNEKIFTLANYSGTLENGYYIEGDKLCSYKAYSKWSRYLSTTGNRSGHIVKKYDYDCDSQKTLYDLALLDLKAIEDAAVTYEVDLYSLPVYVRLGDTVYIVDDVGEIYISARVLSIRRSAINDSITVTLGDFVAKSSGIADNWALFKQQFAVWSEKNRVRYIWIAYADDAQGTGISLDPTNKVWMGMAENRKTDNIDLSDPSIFTWIQMLAKDGEDGVGVQSTTVSYGTTATPNIMPGVNDWSSTIPIVPKGEVLWTRVVTDYTDSSVPDTVSYTYSIQGEDGERGYSITVRSIKYISWMSATTTPPSDLTLWSDTPVSVPPGNYLWTRTEFSDNSVAYGVARQGEDGEQGEPGFSPTIDASKQDGVATIVITDAEGTTTITVEDGEQGDAGVSIVSKQDYYMIADKGDTLTGAMVYETTSDSGSLITLENHVTRPLNVGKLILKPNQNGIPGSFIKWNNVNIGITKTYSNQSVDSTITYDYLFSSRPNPDYVPPDEGETSTVPEFIDIPDFYAGEFDLITGTLRVNTEYASYNNEELSGRWASSMEEYDPNTTPSIGAHVIDLESFSNEYILPENNNQGVIINTRIASLTINDISFSVANPKIELYMDYWTGIPFDTRGWSTTPLETNKFSNYLWWYYEEIYSDGTTYSSNPAVINSIDSRVIEVEKTATAYYQQTTDEINLLAGKHSQLAITQEQINGDLDEVKKTLNQTQADFKVNGDNISMLFSRMTAVDGITYDADGNPIEVDGNYLLKWAKAYLNENGFNVTDSTNVNTKTIVTGNGIKVTSPTNDNEIYLEVNSSNSTIHNTTITGYANIGGASFSRKQETEYDGTSSYGVAIYN